MFSQTDSSVEKQFDTIPSGYAPIKDDNLPKFIYQKDSVGNEVFTRTYALLSIEQLQKLDNDGDLVKLFEKLSIDCDSLDSHYIVVVNKLGEKIVVMQLKIDNLDGQISDGNKLLLDVKKQLSITLEKLDNKTKQYNNDETIIANNNVVIGNLKHDLRISNIKKWAGIGSTATVGAILLGVTIWVLTTFVHK